MHLPEVESPVPQRLERMTNCNHPGIGHVGVCYDSMRMGISPGGKGVPRRGANRRLGVAVFKAHALGRQPVQVWGTRKRVAKTTERVEPMMVTHYDKYVSQLIHEHEHPLLR